MGCTLLAHTPKPKNIFPGGEVTYWASSAIDDVVKGERVRDAGRVSRSAGLDRAFGAGSKRLLASAESSSLHVLGAGVGDWDAHGDRWVAVVV